LFNCLLSSFLKFMYKQGIIVVTSYLRWKNSMTAGLQPSKLGYISQAEMKLNELSWIKTGNTKMEVQWCGNKQ
jgi:hypothetical protein